jgi:hypothetical protein
VARLYPRALGSIFVASYDSQGYGGGIRPRLHTGYSDIYENNSHRHGAVDSQSPVELAEMEVPDLQRRDHKRQTASENVEHLTRSAARSECANQREGPQLLAITSRNGSVIPITRCHHAEIQPCRTAPSDRPVPMALPRNSTHVLLPSPVPTAFC